MMIPTRFLPALATLLLVAPLPLTAQPSETTQEIRQLIHAANAYVVENLEDEAGVYSADGSLEFWSSGGLMNRIPTDAPLGTYESYGLNAKYISVIELADGQVAVAQYYSEGSMHQDGQAPLPNYFTRVTQVYVKEGGEWKVRAAHYSPVVGGTGTDQTSLVN
jgi:hypothetical protein